MREPGDYESPSYILKLFSSSVNTETTFKTEKTINPEKIFRKDQKFTLLYSPESHGIEYTIVGFIEGDQKSQIL